MDFGESLIQLLLNVRLVGNQAFITLHWGGFRYRGDTGAVCAGVFVDT